VSHRDGDEVVARERQLSGQHLVEDDTERVDVGALAYGLTLRLLRGGDYGRAISEYPPSDYRQLVAAAAERYEVAADELLVGAGADEVLDLLAKAFIPPAGAAVVPTPTYAMYRVLTEQRPARAILVPRSPAERGYALDGAAIREAAREAALVWLCDPNNPTGMPEPDGAIADLLAGLRTDAERRGRVAPVVVLDEAYAEFAGRSHAALRGQYPRLVLVRTASKAYALAGMRVGFAIARPALIAEIAPYRPPGSVAIPSVAVVTAALLDPDVLAANLARVAGERARLATAFAAAGFPAGPSVTNFLLVDLGSRPAALAMAHGLLVRGLVPRTFPADHPLAAHLRFTVRDEAEDDRLIAAFAELAPAARGLHDPAPDPEERLP